MFQAFYIITEHCKGEEIAPRVGYTGPIAKDTPVVMTYFDETGMEFVMDDDLIEFRLSKPCPIEPACSCDICGKIIKTKDLTKHKKTDRNCKLIQGEANENRR